MEMKEIDLTKCNNLRYKAKIDGNDDYGRICVENADTGLAFLRSDKEDEYVGVWHCDDPAIQGISERTVTDFELVPRDPETYRDWQVGDHIENTNGSTGRIIFRSGDFVAADIEGTCNCYTCEELFIEEYRLVLTDIEQQIIEGKKKYKPQDGDICFVRTAAGNCFIFIKRSGEDEDEMYKYASIDTNSQYLFPAGVKCVCRKEDIRELRPATDEEKQKLFDAMAKAGKRWNAEKKVVEDIPKSHEFKKGEPVLVRNSFSGKWKIMVFLASVNNEFVVQGVDIPSNWNYCIPYNERTMHLLGTTEDYREE